MEPGGERTGPQQSVGRDGLAAVIIVLLTLALILFVVASLV